MLKAAIAFFALLILGMGGLVVHRQMQRSAAPAPRAVDESVRVATISHGEAVDIARHVRSHGLTIVEFTADF
jgi:hypothetical protein